jgi:exopolysaccharide biosynthesis polyprenyl glycosylphosphotransferase
VTAAWVALCGAAALAVLLIRDALTSMCQEEIRTRLSRLPVAVMRFVSLRMPRDTRDDILEEWQAELEFILHDTEGMPLTRLARGLAYSFSLLRMMLPINAIADRLAALRPGTATHPKNNTTATWTKGYIRQAVAADMTAALASGLLAFQVSFEHHTAAAVRCFLFSLALPVLWTTAIRLAGGYDSRIIGHGADEFRRVCNAGLVATAAVSTATWLTDIHLAKSYVTVALLSATAIDILARLALRKRLHHLRVHGSCMRKVVVVGPAAVVADLAAELRRNTYHGLEVVAACVVGPVRQVQIGAIPVVGGLGNVTDVVQRYDADTVAVLACPEMSVVRLRELAWELEESGTDLCVAPALIDIAGPRTTIRPVAGLPLLQLDRPELAGGKQVIKTVFDRVAAGLVLIFLAPLFAVIALAIRLDDRGPVFFRQTRVGRDGRTFNLIKFRTLVVDAEQRRLQLESLNEGAGVLFKMHRDSRITKVGATLRRWSLDELPQLFNVLIGDMSLVGPRPALPQEVALYGDHMRRRLVVKPGLTGLWQVGGRSGLSWEEALRLDLRYVDNWSFVLDLQILWKTWSAVYRGAGAY